MTNTGSITVNSHGQEVGINAVDIQSVENSGTISVKTENDNAVGIYAKNVTRVTNTGTITTQSTKETVVGLYLINSNAYNNGSVYGMTKVTDHSLLGGNGTFTGNVNVTQSVVAPGNSIGTLNIIGDLTLDAGSTFSVEISNTDSDKVNVTGAGTIDGSTLEIIPTEYITSASYSFIESTVGITGTFAALDSPLVINPEVSKSGGVSTLSVTRNSYDSVVSNPSLRSVGFALESLNTKTSDDITAIINTFDNYKDLSEFQNSLSELTLRLYASSGHATLENTRFLNETINRHLRNDKLGSPSWVLELTSRSGTQAQGELSQQRQTTTGIIAGVDKKIENNFKVGVAVSVTQQHLKEAELKNTSDIRSYSGHLYSMYHLDNWAFSSQLSIAKTDMESKRNIPTFNRRAVGDNTGSLFAFSSLVEYEFNDDINAITPSFELSYASLQNNALTEQKAQDLNLHLDSFNNRYLKSVLGVDITHTRQGENKYLKPRVYAKWIHEYLNYQDDINAKFAIGSTPFTTGNRKEYQNVGIFGGGFDLGFDDTFIVSVNAQAMMTPGADTDYDLGAEFKFAY